MYFQYEERRSLITQICRSDDEARDKSSMAATVTSGASYIAVDRRDRVAYCSIAKGMENKHINNMLISPEIILRYLFSLLVPYTTCSPTLNGDTLLRTSDNQKCIRQSKMHLTS